MKLDRNGLAFGFPGTVTVSYPNPYDYISNRARAFPQNPLQCITHGDLNGNNVLVDRERRVWLIDFERTGWGPVLRDFAELESVIRWELTRSRNMHSLYRFEKALIESGDFGDEIDLPGRDVPDDLRKAIRALATLRQLAGQVSGAEMREYYIGLLFYAVRMIIAGGISSPGQSRPSLVRRAHALLSAAMIVYRLEHWDTRWKGWPDDQIEMRTG
jgi:hypothetical protein